MVLKSSQLLVEFGEVRKQKLKDFSEFHGMTMNETVRRAVDNLLSLPHDNKPVRNVEVGDGLVRENFEKEGWK